MQLRIFQVVRCHSAVEIDGLMTPEEMENEIGQHNDWLKAHDKDLERLNSQIKALNEFCKNLMRAGFTATNHAVAQSAINRMNEIAKTM